MKTTKLQQQLGLRWHQASAILSEMGCEFSDKSVTPADYNQITGSFYKGFS